MVDDNLGDVIFDNFDKADDIWTEILSIPFIVLSNNSFDIKAGQVVILL